MWSYGKTLIGPPTSITEEWQVEGVYEMLKDCKPELLTKYEEAIKLFGKAITFKTQKSFAVAIGFDRKDNKGQVAYICLPGATDPKMTIYSKTIP